MTCRLCGGDLVVDMDFGLVPPANRFLKAEELGLPEPKHRLRFAHCEQCLHAQLMDTVPAHDLFTERPYLYRSGTSQSWRRHCTELANEVPFGQDRVAIDIGSNDGTMVKALTHVGYDAHGIEPAEVFTGYPVHHVWWTREVAQSMVSFIGGAHLITAMNVFAHVEDSRAFLEACADALHPDGTLILEFPHLVPMLTSGAFDAIYHEHIHYWSLRPLLPLARAVGLDVVAVVPLELHGGSLRVYLRPIGARIPPDPSVKLLLDLEAQITPDAYTEFALRVVQWQDDWRSLLHRLWSEGNRIVGYGASAKGNTLLTTTPVEEVPTKIVDDNRHKQGWWTPGSKIPVVPMKQMGEADVVLILAWNVATDLIAKLKQQGYRGKVVVPFPVIQVY